MESRNSVSSRVRNRKSILLQRSLPAPDGTSLERKKTSHIMATMRLRFRIIQELIASSSNAVYEVVLDTDKGDSYGLRLLENTFLRKGELGFATGFTTKSKGCDLKPDHYKSLIGKTITGIRFVTENGIFVIQTELKVEEQEIYALMNIPYDGFTRMI